MRQLVLAAAVLGSLLLAGCAGAPTEDPDELAIEYQVDNDASTVYNVTLVVAPDPFEEVRLTFANGTTRTYDVGRIDQVPPSALGQATDIEPLGDPVQTQTLSLEPRTGRGGTLDNVTDESVVLYTVRQPDGGVAFRGWGGVRCPTADDRLRIEVRINADESFNAGVACTG